MFLSFAITYTKTEHNISFYGNGKVFIFSKCDGFTGADLGKLVHKSAQLRLKESFQSDDTNLNNDDIFVSQRHFDAAFNDVNASVSKAITTAES